MSQPTKPNLLDRLIAWRDPERAVRRAQARNVLAAYEAATRSRLQKGRRATGSANADVLRAGASLRETARHLEQNYDLARGVLNALVTNTIGAKGIGTEPQPRRKDGSIHDALAREILKLHTAWQKRPEVTRQHNWSSTQRIAGRTWYRDGEVFSQMISGFIPSLEHGSKVPFSLELLEADYIPMDLNTMATTNASRIVQGVEVNGWGAPLGYHVFKDDQFDGPYMAAGKTKRIPAARMLHVKVVDRIRQQRGVSVFASVLNRFDDLKDYEESERIAAKIAASMAAFIKKGAADMYAPAEGDEPSRNMKFRPGMVFDDLRPGEEIGMIDTNRPNPNLETYRSGQLKAIAAGTGPTHSSISKSYDGTYSAQRQELVEGYSAYAVLSDEFTSRFVQPAYEQFLAMAIASGSLKLPADLDMDTLYSATYIPPAMPWIDPLKEAKAFGELEDRGYISGPEIIRKRGGNPLDVLEQQGRWRREKAAEGIPNNASNVAPDPSPLETDDGESRA